MLEPMNTKSSTERLQPNLFTPYTLIVLPKRAKERTDMLELMLTKSVTLKSLPNQVLP
jgi:hypothetical protein